MLHVMNGCPSNVRPWGNQGKQLSYSQGVTAKAWVPTAGVARRLLTYQGSWGLLASSRTKDPVVHINHGDAFTTGCRMDDLPGPNGCQIPISLVREYYCLPDPHLPGT
jgi:hypothetical protein